MADTKTLFIVRHGKSSWEIETLADSDRPLTERGIKNAYDIALRVKNKGLIPQRLVSSPAIRALHTAVIFSRVLEIPGGDIIINEDLYHAAPDNIIKLIGKTPAHIKALMIFGHNPGFTDLSNILSNLSIDNVPTSGLVKLVFKTGNWGKIGRDKLVDASIEIP